MSDYPYGLNKNPFSHIPTPSLEAARVLGGRSWREAKERLLLCIKELHEQIGREEGGFSLVTVVGSPGTGKTHLALHIKGLEDGFYCAYVDLTRYEKKDLVDIWSSTLQDLGPVLLEKLRQKMILRVAQLAKQGNRDAKRALRFDILDRLFGHSVDEAAFRVIQRRRRLNIRALRRATPRLEDNRAFEPVAKVLLEDWKWFSDVKSPDEALQRLNGLGEALCIAHRVLVLQVDELVASRPLADGLKAVINSKPSSILLFVSMVPPVEIELGRLDAPLYDRLHKGAFLCPLSHPRDPDEFYDIIQEYLKHNGVSLRSEDILLLKSFIHYCCIDIGMEDLREVLAVFREVFERARGYAELRETDLAEAVSTIRPAAVLRDSVMRMSIADYLRIKREKMTSSDGVSDILSEAIRKLGIFLSQTGALFYAHRSEKMIDTSGGLRDSRRADIYLEEKNGSRVVLDVKITEGPLTEKQLENAFDIATHGGVQKVTVITNTSHSKDIEHAKLRFVRIHEKQIADLIYFNEKMDNGRLTSEDQENALRLAKMLEMVS